MKKMNVEMMKSDVIKNKRDFVFLVEVRYGNPNGDPDAGNMPRVDAWTGKGFVTNGCIKRKVREYMDLVMGGVNGYLNYVRPNGSLTQRDKEALVAVGVDLGKVGKESDDSPTDGKDDKSKKKDNVKEAMLAAKDKNPNLDEDLRTYMSNKYVDIRMFGGSMTTFLKGALACGQLRGPIQIGDALSIDPIYIEEISVTRVGVREEEKEGKELGTIGRRYVVPYALYRVEGHVSASIARKMTHLTEADLELFWEAIINMFENEHSSVRGEMATRELIVFTHDSELGNAPAYKLFNLVKVEKKEGVTCPTCYEDYNVTIDMDNLPKGVTVERKI